MIGSFDTSRLLHGSQRIRLHSPLPPAGRLTVACEVADIQDKGEGKLLYGTKLYIDQKSKNLVLENYAQQPVRFNEIRRLK